MSFKNVSFLNSRNLKLAGRIDFPMTGKPRNFIIFSHVFTGHKNLIGAKYISKALTRDGYAVLRFDFTGLGESEGEFSESNFSTNIDDIKSAARFLEEYYQAPSVLVGQSLGGAAAVFAASELPSIKAVATVGAPSEPEHVMHLFGCKSEDIENVGEAEVSIGGREFTIKKQFLEDLRTKNMYQRTKELRKALLIMHSPQDEIVEIENAAKIYHAAFHPKSFVTLDGSDHLLTDKAHAHYAGEVIAAWVKRYIEIEEEEDKLITSHQVIARLGDEGFTTDVKAGKHYLTADEPKKVGGNDLGPSPYELLASSLATCKVMTVQMYARRKKWDVREVRAHVSYERSYDEDCRECSDAERRLDNFHVKMEFEGALDETQIKRLKEIADKCPVHKTLTGNIHIISEK